MFPNATFRTKSDVVKWESVSLGSGEKIEGIIAGPLVVVDTHWLCDRRSPKGRSVPCRQQITQGKLGCLCQLKPMSVRKLGYCPVIDKYKDRWVVMLSETVAAKVEPIKPGTFVRFERPKNVKKPLSISLPQEFDFPSQLLKMIKAAACHDIHEYLLHLWQDRELTESFGIEFIAAKEPAASLDDQQPAA